MKTVSMLEVRKNMGSVIKTLQAGERLLLTYRGKPLARLVPVDGEKPLSLEEDPLFSLPNLAVPSPLGKLDHDTIDKLLYG